MTLAPETPLLVDDPFAREQACNLRSLLALSTLMTESGLEEQIVHLMATSVCSFGPCRVEGVFLAGTGWCRAGGLPPATRADLEGQFGRVRVGGGPMSIPGIAWSFAFPLRSLAGHHGHLVVSSETE